MQNKRNNKESYGALPPELWSVYFEPFFVPLLQEHTGTVSAEWRVCYTGCGLRIRNVLPYGHQYRRTCYRCGCCTWITWSGQAKKPGIYNFLKKKLKRSLQKTALMWWWIQPSICRQWWMHLWRQIGYWNPVENWRSAFGISLKVMPPCAESNRFIIARTSCGNTWPFCFIRRRAIEKLWRYRYEAGI